MTEYCVNHEKQMAKLPDEVSWLGQDIFCRYVAQEGLQPKGDVQEIAQSCLALASEFFRSFEATQEELEKTERQELAHQLASALLLELRGASINGSASTEAPEAPTLPKAWAEKPQEPQVMPLPRSKAKMKAPAPKAPGEGPEAPKRKVKSRKVAV
jgi:hypothetical protein